MSDDTELPPEVIDLSERRKQKQARRKITPVSTDPSLPLIRVIPGEIPRATDEAEQVLLRSNIKMYQRGKQVVKLDWMKMPTAGGGEVDTLNIVTVDEAYLFEAFSRVARFEKFDARAGGYVLSDCPDKIAKTYASSARERKLPVLLGVVHAPTFRPDGSLIDIPGYDPVTRLVYQPFNEKFPAIPDKPTKEQAKHALARLRKLICRYKFEKRADRAVALSLLLTALVRAVVPCVPLHAIDATAPGSGKSKLVNMACVLATGREAGIIGPSDDRDASAELDKQLGTRAMAGDPVIAMDNLTAPLNSALACKMVSESRVMIRVLGHSKDVEIPNTSLITVTGNGLRIEGDLTRRTLVARIDTKVERPELREFDFEPVELAKLNRPQLVTDVLTIIRAYRLAADKVVHNASFRTLGGFEAWSAMVREPLVWLGEDDPCATMERTRCRDIKRVEALEVVDSWRNVLGINTRVPVRKVIEAAGVFGDGDHDLREALLAVARVGAGVKEEISAKRLGNWLATHEGRVFPGDDGHQYRFMRDGERAHTLYWILEKIA